MDKKSYLPDKNDPARGPELIELCDRLRTVPAFHTLRGKLGGSMSDWFDKNVTDSSDTTDADERAEEFGKQVVVLNRIYAQLRHRGKVHAESEMKSALSIQGRIMERETFSPELTSKFTLYMLNPTKTFMVLNFLRSCHRPALYEVVAALMQHRQHIMDEESMTAAWGLLDVLPSLEGVLRETYRDTSREGGLALMAAYAMDVVMAFPPPSDLLRACSEFRQVLYEHSASGEFQWYKLADLLDRFGDTGWWKPYESLFPVFVFLVPGSREEVLKRLGDPEGKRVATWEFSLPLWYPEAINKFRESGFGFLSDDEYQQEKERHPTLVSDVMQYGYGVKLVANTQVQWSEFNQFAFRLG